MNSLELQKHILRRIVAIEFFFIMGYNIEQ
jgi:hypothetical protein